MHYTLTNARTYNGLPQDNIVPHGSYHAPMGSKDDIAMLGSNLTYCAS